MNFRNKNVTSAALAGKIEWDISKSLISNPLWHRAVVLIQGAASHRGAVKYWIFCYLLVFLMELMNIWLQGCRNVVVYQYKGAVKSF